MPLPILLLTRPEAQSRAFARSLGDGPWEVLIAPLTGIVPLDWDRSLAEGVRGVILTSANAVPAVAWLAPLPAWCVGAATARAAAAAGFRAIPSAGDAVALLADLDRERPKGPLLHAHGRHLARDLTAAPEGRGLGIRSAAVYEARRLDWPEGLAARLEGRRVVAPVFSPRAAAELSARLSRLSPGSAIPAISAAAAARLSTALQPFARIALDPMAMADTVRAELAPEP